MPPKAIKAALSLFLFIAGVHLYLPSFREAPVLPHVLEPPTLQFKLCCTQREGVWMSHRISVPPAVELKTLPTLPYRRPAASGQRKICILLEGKGHL